MLIRVSEILFWLCVLTPIYVFFGYPALLNLLTLFFEGKPRVDLSYEPIVSIVIAAYNEERTIERAIRSALDQDYPADKLEVIIGSDGSTDSTNAVVAEWCKRDERVRLLALPRQGKALTDNSLVAAARGEIVVATSAFAFGNPNWVRTVVRSFSEPTIGCVTGPDRMVNPHVSSVARSEASYFHYEFFLRCLETKLGIFALSNGASNAFRKRLYRAIPPSADVDNFVPLQVIDQGYRVVHEPDAWVFEEVTERSGDQLRTRTRQISRSFRDLLRFPELLNPIRHPGIAFSLWSHRLLRWSTPLFLLAAFALGAVLAPSSAFYRCILFVQIVSYAACLLAYLIGERMRLPRLLSLPASFLVVNLAMIRGTWNVFSGHEIQRWRE